MPDKNCLPRPPDKKTRSRNDSGTGGNSKKWNEKLLGCLSRGLFSRGSSGSGDLVGFGLLLGSSAGNDHGGLVSWFVHVNLSVAGYEHDHGCSKEWKEDFFHGVNELVMMGIDVYSQGRPTLQVTSVFALVQRAVAVIKNHDTGSQST